MFKLIHLKIVLIVLLLNSVKALRADVWVYGGSDNNLKSAKYFVRIIQGENVYESFVYRSKNTNTDHVGHLTDINHWTNFSFEGKITIEITKLFGDPVRYCIVRPKEARLKPEVSGHVIKLTIEKPAMLYLEINEAEEDPLFVFANPPEDEIPDEMDEYNLYYGPGFHEVGSVLLNGRNVYIAGGAYVSGSFLVKGNRPVRIFGRGIISGGGIANGSADNNFVEVDGRANIDVEGVVFTDGSGYGVFSNGKANLDYVKFLGWSSSSKGLLVGDSSIIRNCFFKVGSDVLTLNHSNINVSGCVIWQQANGAPFQFTLKEKRNVENVNVENIEIIRIDIYEDSIWASNKTIINCRDMGNSIFQNILFDNVNVEGNVHRLLGINTGQGGVLNGLTIKDLKIEGVLANENYISAEKGSVSNILFDNVEANYMKITNEFDAFIEKRGNVADIEFKWKNY